MSTRRPAPTLRRASLHWLLWLALVLPLAQSAAAWHALSHVRVAATASDDDRSATHTAAQCDLCLAGSAVAGGALASTPLGLPASLAAEARPVATAASALHGLVALAYRSRAPPLTLR